MGDKRFHQSIINNCPLAYSCYRMLPDGQGNPVDYEFIEINPTFEEITGLKAAFLLGKKVTEVISQMKGGTIDWVDFYKKIAAGGPSKEFDQYFAHEDAWYRVSAYSPRPGYVVTYFNSISPSLKKDGGIIDIFLGSAMINQPELAGEVTFTALDITEKKRAAEALKVSEEKYRLIAENTADLITVLNLSLQNIYVSPSIENFLGYTVEEALSQSLEHTLTKESFQKACGILTEEMTLEKKGEADPCRSRLLELEAFHKNGSTISIESKLSFIRDKNLKPTAILNVSRDISERKRAEEEIFKQKAEFQALFTNTNDAMVFFDEKENTTIINSQFTKMFGYRIEEAVGKNVNSLVDPGRRIPEYGSSKTLKGETIELETVRYHKNGQAIQVNLKGGPVFIDGIITGAYAVYTDITERKRYEEELKYLSLHDKLTGLYNRAFFEAELNRLARGRDYPITIFSADVDGLKLINDTMGHDSGDKLLKDCAAILKKSLRSGDILARIGGDEFTVLLPNTNEQIGEMLTWRIRSYVDQYNREHSQRQLSISVGMATAHHRNNSLEETFKTADDSMYRSKLRKASSAKSKIIDALMRALGERDYITEGHAQRLTALCQRIGEAKGLTSSQLDNITLLAQVHDLGKVGIPDKILFKKSSFTEEEWKVMHQHPEKGYRIAVSSPDLSGIADLILKHHEKWDGTGYPLGLKGQEIPVECRILAIVDAFDAMTNSRPYSKAKTIQEALEELRRCSGTQFDPELIGIFLSEINNIKQF